jgi:hypothetical protein
MGRHGRSWPAHTPEGIADLAAVVAVATDDVWAVGGFVDHTANAVRTLVEHWDGTAWSVVASANKGPSDNHLWGISAATGRLLAVGDRFTGGGTGPARPARARTLLALAAVAVRVGAGSLQSPHAPVPYRRQTSNPPATSPEAITQLTEGVEAGEESLTLLGATGTGKTFTIAHVVEAIQRPDRW